MILATWVNKILDAFGGVERGGTAVTCHSLFPVLIACLAPQEFKLIFLAGERSQYWAVIILEERQQSKERSLDSIGS